MAEVTDRIEKRIFLKASRSRVWRALADSREFGAWFGVRLDAPFVAGASMKGTITPTLADAEVAKQQKPYEGKSFEMTVERLEPERLFSFRWHPYAVDPDADYSSEPTTLVVFEIHEAEGGVLLTVTESGFDRIPIERRAKAFAANDGGWALQVALVEKHLAQTP